MLAGLVLASFLVKPEAAASKPAGPLTSADPARAEAFGRGASRPPRDIELVAASLHQGRLLIEASVPSRTEDLVVMFISSIADPAVAEQASETERTPEPEPTPEPTPPAPAPRPPAPRPVAPGITESTASAEVRMLELMNASRARAGLTELVMDGGAAVAARAHSAAEARVRYVYHDGPDGAAHARNVPACGTGWYGENTGKIWNGNIDALHVEFMAEPWEPINHRTNIMDPAFRRVGVGAVMGPDAMYMTMVFCR
jgi:uncharacterized protein YkwD